jgi:hypothetical protein
MSDGQIMLPYTIKAGIISNDYPVVVVGEGTGKRYLGPSNAADNSYWWYFLDNSTQKLVYSLVVPGSSNSSVPSGIDTYMSNPNLLFGIVTQFLSSFYLPQGALFDYLVTYGRRRTDCARPYCFCRTLERTRRAHSTCEQLHP